MQQQAKPICCKSDDSSLLALFFSSSFSKKIFATIGNECRETLISHQNDQNVRHFRDCGNYMLILMKHDLELEFWTFTTTLRRYPHTVVEKKNTGRKKYPKCILNILWTNSKKSFPQNVWTVLKIEFLPKIVHWNIRVISEIVTQIKTLVTL